MKSINRKLYSIIVICLLLLCFSLNVLPTESSAVSTPSESKQETIETNSNNSAEDKNDVSNPSSAAEESSSSSESSSSAVESDISTTTSDSSAASSAESDTSNESNVTSTSSEKVSSEKSSSENSSSEKTSSKNEVGGYVDDESNSSDLKAEDVSSKLDNTNATENKKGNKNIGLLILLWILAFVLIGLIIASVGALVYVNKKEFLNATGFFENFASPKRRFSVGEKAKVRNNHKNRTNVYKPRD